MVICKHFYEEVGFTSQPAKGRGIIIAEMECCVFCMIIGGDFSNLRTGRYWTRYSYSITVRGAYIKCYPWQSVCPKFGFWSLTLSCLNQMVWSLYIICITTKHRSSYNLGEVNATVLKFCPFIILYASRGIICLSWTHSPFM